MNRWKRGLSLALCALLLLAMAVPALADSPRPYALEIRVNGRSFSVRAYSESYEGNLFLSLRDLSQSLTGTEKQFRIDYQAGGTDGEVWTVRRGQSAGASGSVQTALAPYAVSLRLWRNRIFVDGGERRYYTYRSDDRDLYMALADVQLMLDLTASYDDDGVLRLETDSPFLPDPWELLREDYFGAVNAVLVGDADTGEILFSHNRVWRYPIASVSKLVTWLLLAEAVDEGSLSWQDTVTVSAKASTLSWSADGVIGMAAGAQIPAEELMQAMMLASSNECALALAEYAAGSEEAFVARMNERAKELGLRSARFYTPHGLPSYSGSAITGKRQNAMSAEDLFRLSTYILHEHPELTELTEKQYINLSKLSFSTANSNPLVFNVPGVNGLKTGSTNRAGYCVVASLPLTLEGETHTLVTVVLGAETAELRGQCAEMLLRYAQNYYLEHGFAQVE